MIITSGRPEHLGRINELVQSYGLAPITSHFLNKHDISAVALHNDKIVGFLWCGVMASKQIGYLDYFTIDREYAGQNVVTLLGQRLVRTCKNRGVHTLLGSIRDGEFQIKSVSGALKIGMVPDSTRYVMVYGNVDKMSNHLGL